MESNSASHVTAKLSLTISESFCLNKDNLSRVVHFEIVSLHFPFE